MQRSLSLELADSQTTETRLKLVSDARRTCGILHLASSQSFCCFYPLLFPECSAGAAADLLFLVDGSWSVGKANFKHIRAFLSAAASAFQIGQDRTRVGVVQYGSDARVEFRLDAHPSRPALLRAIGTLPYMGGDTRTGSRRSPGRCWLGSNYVVHPFSRSPGHALKFLLEKSLTEEAGARKDFPKVLVVVTDSKSVDPVENSAGRLRSAGVEVFVLGV